MVKVIKRLFRFDYWSPLDIATCRERLTPEYRAELVKKGVHYKEKLLFGWRTYMGVSKKGVVLMSSQLSWFSFGYRFTLEERPQGTILHCSHRLFASVALLVPTLILLVQWFFLARSIIVALIGARSIVLFLFLLLLPIVLSALVFMLFYFLESAARSETNKLLKLLVDAEPIKSNSCFQRIRGL